MAKSVINYSDETWKEICAERSTTMAFTSLNFGFLTNDLRSLIERSREVLKEAEVIQDLAKSEHDPQRRTILIENANKLISIANGIAQSVSTLNTNATTTISTATTSAASWSPNEETKK